MPITLASDGHSVCQINLRGGGTPGRVKIHRRVVREAGPTAAAGGHEINIPVAVVIHAFKGHP